MPIWWALNIPATTTLPKSKMYVYNPTYLCNKICVCICVCIYIYFVVHFEVLSRVWLFVTPWTVASRLLLPWDSQVRILEWVVISFSRDLGIPTQGSKLCLLLGRQILYHRATWEVHICALHTHTHTHTHTHKCLCILTDLNRYEEC